MAHDLCDIIHGLTEDGSVFMKKNLSQTPISVNSLFWEESIDVEMLILLSLMNAYCFKLCMCHFDIFYFFYFAI